MNAIPTGRLLRGTLARGQARALFCETTQMGSAATKIHTASAVCAAALSRGLSGVALLTAATEDTTSSLTMTIKGGGPAGALVVVAHGRRLKAYMDHPCVSLPSRTDGKLDVGGAIGAHGQITIIRDMGLREPYIGQCPLANGEIAEDIALYCTMSEQQPTLCALGALVAGDTVLSSGGLMVQPLPGCDEETLSMLELRAPVYGDLSRHLLETPLEELYLDFFRDLYPEIHAIEPLALACDCSTERMERVLISLGRAALEEMIADHHNTEISCNFCAKKHTFSETALTKLLAEAFEP